MRSNVIEKNQFDEAQSYRIDSEFWDVRLIENESTLNEGHRMIDVVCNKDAIQTVSEESNQLGVNPKPIKYVEIGDIDLDTGQHHISTIYPGSIPSRATFRLKEGDVVVSTVRPIRNAVGFIEEDDLVGSSGFTVLRSENCENEYLWAMCKTHYFKDFLFRRQRNSMYPAVRPDDVLNARIVIAPQSLRNEICSNIRKSLKDLQQQNESYSKVKSDFLRRIGAVITKKHTDNHYIDTFRSIRENKRIDAKYFNPRYDVLNRVFGNCERVVSLEEVARVRKGVEVGSGNYVHEGIPFIRVSDIDRCSLRTNKSIPKEVFERFSSSRPKRGEILLTKDATMGAVHYFDYEPLPMLISSGVLALRVRNKSRVPAHYLALVLDTEITGLQIQRGSSGSNISHWNLGVAKECGIPILGNDEMRSIELRLETISNSVSVSRRNIGSTIARLNDYISSRRGK